MKSKQLLFLVLLILSNQVEAQDIDSSQIYLRNAFILDYEADKFRIGNILIKNDKIQKIEFGKNKEPRKGVINYNLKNKYIIPGLIDAHVHFGTDPSDFDNFEDTKARLKYLLVHGVTTVRDMAGDARYLNYVSRLALLDEIPSPDIYFSALLAGETFFKDPRTHQSSQGVEPGTAPWMRAVDINSDFEKVIAEAKGTGASGIKIYANLEAEVVDKIVAAAHQQGMIVWAHATVFPAKPSELTEVDVLSHATLLAWEGADEIPENAFTRYKKNFAFDIENPVYTQLMDSLKAHETIIDATLFVFSDRSEKVYQQGIDLTQLAYKKGVKIAVGTDTGVDTTHKTASIIDEMKTLQKEVGMESVEILKSATLVNAATIGKENEIGSIEVGKKANLVILNANPLRKITNCSKIDFVMKNGKIVE